MTGHGEAHRHEDGLSVAVEIRTVNNRYFKLNLRLTEGYAAARVARRSARPPARSPRHGAGQPADRPRAAARRLSAERGRAARAICSSSKRLSAARSAATAAQLAPLLALPGVVREPTAEYDAIEAQWPLIETVAERGARAPGQDADRRRPLDGRRPGRQRPRDCRGAGRSRSAARRSSSMPIARRLTERLNKLLAEVGVRIEPADVVREVGMFAERSDISEEIVRLRSHLEQFDTVMAADESQGRKLEFLTQEMFRETNTIGSQSQRRRDRPPRHRDENRHRADAGIQPRARLLHRGDQRAGREGARRLPAPPDAEERRALHHAGTESLRGQGALGARPRAGAGEAPVRGCAR